MFSSIQNLRGAYYFNIKNDEGKVIRWSNDLEKDIDKCTPSLSSLLKDGEYQSDVYENFRKSKSLLNYYTLSRRDVYSDKIENFSHVFFGKGSLHVYEKGDYMKRHKDSRKPPIEHKCSDDCIYYDRSNKPIIVNHIGTIVFVVEGEPLNIYEPNGNKLTSESVFFTLDIEHEVESVSHRRISLAFPVYGVPTAYKEYTPGRVYEQENEYPEDHTNYQEYTRDNIKNYLDELSVSLPLKGREIVSLLQNAYFSKNFSTPEINEKLLSELYEIYRDRNKREYKEYDYNFEKLENTIKDLNRPIVIILANTYPSSDPSSLIGQDAKLYSFMKERVFSISFESYHTANHGDYYIQNGDLKQFTPVHLYLEPSENNERPSDPTIYDTPLQTGYIAEHSEYNDYSGYPKSYYHIVSCLKIFPKFYLRK